MARLGGRAVEALRAFLLVQGPATAQDLRGSLHLSRAETYEVVRKAANRGLIKVVAHVHTDDNHRSQAWDVDSPDRELVWLRHEQRVRGRYCTCLPTARRGGGVRAARRPTISSGGGGAKTPPPRSFATRVRHKSRPRGGNPPK